ncbi:MAG: DUF4258 domain-containing protein [Fibrobacteraceae bacterium]|nr:DUF4258 domain-containing protein [Fibrobacteraceae bacterium]
MDMAAIKNLAEGGKIKWSVHCAQRIMERGISREDVLSCIACGEIIEDYPNDFPLPSCLIFGMTVAGKALHVVAGTDAEQIYIVTAYYPNTVKFEEDLKTRRT